MTGRPNHRRRSDASDLPDPIHLAAALRADAGDAPDPVAAARALARRLRTTLGVGWAELRTLRADGTTDGVVVDGEPDSSPRTVVDGPLTVGRSFRLTFPGTARLPVRTVRAITTGVRTGLLAHGDAEERAEALCEYVAVLENAARLQRAELQDVIDLARTLRDTGQRLAAQLDVDRVVTDAVEAVTRATGAAFGALRYTLTDEFGDSDTRYALSGITREAFDASPWRDTELFAPVFASGAVRTDDVATDPRYRTSAPEGHPPVRSHLAVPVTATDTRDVLGWFVLAHPEPGRFTDRHERFTDGIAGYTAIALANARRFTRHRSMAGELARSMLPAVPDIPGLRIVSRYLPAGGGSEVGGDWFDVIELPGGRTAFVIGDVVGRGIPAAAVMGQMRTAIRSYALLDLPPSDVLHNVSQLARVTPGAKFITCLYAVHDPIDGTLTYANAGHLPAILLGPDDSNDSDDSDDSDDTGASVRQIAEALGMPLGVGEQYPQEEAPFPAGTRLVLYTDGLVESRTRELGAGIDALVAQLRALPAGVDLDEGCDALIERLTGGSHDDDVALLCVDHVGAPRRTAAMPLTRDVDLGDVRQFVRTHLARWGAPAVADDAVRVTTELVTNALRHASAPLTLRLHSDGTRLTVDVADRATALPHILATGGIGQRGLRVVESAATRWGTRTTPEGKVVWAELTIR